LQQDPNAALLMTHADGIALPGAVLKTFKNQVEHDPANLSEARDLAAREDAVPIGLFYRNLDAERYDKYCLEGLAMTAEEKVESAQTALDRFLI